MQLHLPKYSLLSFGCVDSIPNHSILIQTRGILNEASEVNRELKEFTCAFGHSAGRAPHPHGIAVEERLRLLASGGKFLRKISLTKT